MSLINRMLQDLDARGVDQRLPCDVRPLPPVQRSRRPLVLGGLALVLLVGGLALYQLAPWQAPALPVSPSPPLAVSTVTPPQAPEPAVPPPLEAPKPAAPLIEVVSPLPATTPAETSQRSRPVPSKAAPTEKKSVEKPAKPSAVDGGEPAAAPRRSPEALPRPAAIEQAPPAAGKAAREPTIARSDSLGSPRERADSEYRKAIGAVNQGRVGEAIDGLNRVLHDDSLHAGARQLLVKLLLEAKRVDEALQVLHEGLQGQPAQLGWAMTLARLQVDRGDLAGAWQTLEFSLPAAGHSADYLGFAAHVLQRLGRHREAIAQYQAATRLAPGDGRWWLGLGLVMESEGRSSEAREAFLRARQCGNLGSALSALVEQKLR